MRDKIRKCLDEIYEESDTLPVNFGDEILEEVMERFIEDHYPITKNLVIEQMLWCYMCKMQ